MRSLVVPLLLLAILPNTLANTEQKIFNGLRSDVLAPVSYEAWLIGGMLRKDQLHFANLLTADEQLEVHKTKIVLGHDYNIVSNFVPLLSLVRMSRARLPLTWEVFEVNSLQVNLNTAHFLNV